MSTTTTEAAVTKRIERDYGTDPWTWPTLRLSRDLSLFRIYECNVCKGDGQAVPDVKELHEVAPGEGSVLDRELLHVGSKIELREAAEAWQHLNYLDESEESIGLMVGPGTGSVTLEDPAFHPQLWSVWSVDCGTIPTFFGYFTRLDARNTARRIIARGGSPIIATPYLMAFTDWDDDDRYNTGYEPVGFSQTETLPSVQSGLNEADRRNLLHVLDLARRGKSSGASTSEKQARKLVQAVLTNAIGLDDKASSGISDLVDMIQANPQDGVEFVRETIK